MQKATDPNLRVRTLAKSAEIYQGGTWKKGKRGKSRKRRLTFLLPGDRLRKRKSGIQGATEISRRQGIRGTGAHLGGERKGYKKQRGQGGP